MKKKRLLLYSLILAALLACEKDFSGPSAPSVASPNETKVRMYRSSLESAFFSLGGAADELLANRSIDPILQDANDALYQINLAEDIVTKYSEQIGIPDWPKALSSDNKILWVPVYKENRVNGVFGFIRMDSALYFRPLLRPLYTKLYDASITSPGIIPTAIGLFQYFDGLDGLDNHNGGTLDTRSNCNPPCFLVDLFHEPTGRTITAVCACNGYLALPGCCETAGLPELDGGAAEAGGGPYWDPGSPFDNPSWWLSWWEDILGRNPANTTMNTGGLGSGGGIANLTQVEKSRLLNRLIDDQYVYDWLLDNLNPPIGEHGGSLYHIILGGNPHIAGPLFLFLNGFYDGVPPDPNVAMDLLDLIADFGIVGGQYAPPLDLSQAEIEHILSFDHSLIADIRAILEANPNNEKAIQAVHDLMALQMCTMALPGCQVTDYDNDLPLLLSFYEGLTDEAYDWIHSAEIENSGIKHELIQFLINGPMQPASDRAQHVNAVVEFLAEHQGSLQFDEAEIQWLLENPDKFQGTVDFLTDPEVNFDPDAIKSVKWTIDADLAGVGGLDELFSQASMSILIDFTDCCPEGIDDFDGWTNVPEGQAHAEAVRDEMLMLKQIHPNWPDFLIRHWAQYRFFKDGLHFMFDGCGLIEGFGAPCDIANGFFYAIEGQGGEATMSFMGALPGGFYVTASRVVKKAVNIGGTTRRFAWRQVGNYITFSHAGSYRKVWKGVYPALNSSDNIAHHVIPKQFWDNPLVQKAAQANPENLPDGVDPFHMNMPSNGWPVYKSRHTSNHSNYSDQISVKMQQWVDNNPNASPEEAAEALSNWQNSLKALIGQDPTGPNINTLTLPDII